MKKHKKILFYSVVILLILGCFFRLNNLNSKPYWGDEVYTSIRVFGYTRAEIIQTFANGRIFGVEEIQKFQHPDPERGVLATINSLASEDAEITPLHFMLARVWAFFFGSSVAAMRLLPSLFSLLALPCIYWLCLELFESPMVGWGAVSLASISPLYVLYAQESRNYSLWILATLLSCASMLKAIRTHRPVDWLVYGLTISFSLYSCILTGAVIIAHGTYVLTITRFRQTKTIVSYLLSTTLGLLTFIPWGFILLHNKASLNRAVDMTLSYNYLSIVKHWSGMSSRLLIDFNLTSADAKVKQLAFVMIVVSLLVLLLAGYSVYFLVSNTTQKIWLFTLLLLLAIPTVLFPKSISPDFSARYLLPSFIAIHLAIAYTLSIQATKLFKYSRKSNFWRSVAVLVITSGVASCTLYSFSDSWQNKGFNEYNHQVANIVNQDFNTLVVSDLDGDRFEGNLSNVMSLSYSLNPTQVKLQLVAKGQVPKISKQFEHVFALTPSHALLQGLRKSGYTVVPVYKARRVSRDSDIYLWRISNAAVSRFD